MLIQSSKALLFLQNILIEVISHLSLERCICTHSLVVDHMAAVFVCISPILLFFLSMQCLVLIQPSPLEWIFGFHNVT